VDLQINYNSDNAVIELQFISWTIP